MATPKINIRFPKTDVPADTPAEKKQPNSSIEGSVGTLMQKMETPAASTHFTKMIPRRKIMPNPQNDYPMESIERLADSILNYGLQHNLVVNYTEDADIYHITSGERRFRAIAYLIDNKDQWDPALYEKHVQIFEAAVPCNVKKDLTERQQRIVLLIANEEVRASDPARTAKAIQELEELLRLESDGARINTAETIAEKVGMSSRQVKKYQSTAQLIPELQKAFESKKVTLNDASSYARLSEEEQRFIAELIENDASKDELKYALSNIKDLKSTIREKDEALSTAISEQKKLLAEKQSLEKELSQAAADSQKKYELGEQAGRALSEHDITTLQSRLETVQKKEASAQKQLEHERAELQKLRNELKKSQEEKKAKLPAAVVKAAILDSQIQSMGKQLQIIYQELRSYEELYQNSDPDDLSTLKSPAEYLKELAAFISN